MHETSKGICVSPKCVIHIRVLLCTSLHKNCQVAMCHTEWNTLLLAMNESHWNEITSLLVRWQRVTLNEIHYCWQGVTLKWNTLLLVRWQFVTLKWKLLRTPKYAFLSHLYIIKYAVLSHLYYKITTEFQSECPEARRSLIFNFNSPIHPHPPQLM